MCEAPETPTRSLSREAPRASLSMRQAFNMAINRNELNQKYYQGTRVPAYGFIPSTSPWYNPDGQLARFDPIEAKKLFGQASAKGTTKTVRSLCLKTPESQTLFQLLKEQELKVGTDVKLRQVEQGTLVTAVLSGGGGDIPWDVACFRSGQFGDPDELFNDLSTGGSSNVHKYSRTDVDNWLKQARATTDTAKRKTLYDKVQAQVSKDVVILPLLFDLWGNVFSPNLSGLSTPSPSVLGIIRPGDLYKTK